MNDPGEYQQFVIVSTRSDNTTRSFGITTGNPADIGSRGGHVVRDQRNMEKGPSWLSSPSEWPQDKRLDLEASPESKAEAKLTKQILAVAITEPDVFDELLDGYPSPKLSRIGAWIHRFITKSKKDSRERHVGPIKTTAIKQQQLWWTWRDQKEAEGDPHFLSNQIQLNLQSNDEGSSRMLSEN